MKKPKKITVKFFLNNNLQEVKTDQGAAYPLYTQITYNRRNTQIKCYYGGYYVTLEEAQVKNRALLSFEEALFRKTVQYEINRQGNKFELKGLGKKYDTYCVGIHSLFNKYLKVRLKNMIYKATPADFLQVIDFDRSEADIETLYIVCQKLFDNLDAIFKSDFLEEVTLYKLYKRFYPLALDTTQYQFPVVIDWLNKSHVQDLTRKLNQHYKKDLDKVQESLSVINRIVLSRIELG